MEKIIYRRHADANTFDPDSQLYLEHVSGAAPHYAVLEHAVHNESLKSELIDSALFRLAVCDERVFQAVSGSKSLQEKYFAGNIRLIAEFLSVGLGALSVKSANNIFLSVHYETNECEPESPVLKVNPKDYYFDCLVIHIGILEKYLANPQEGNPSEESTGKQCKKLVTELIAQLAHDVVLTSGRGQVPEWAMVETNGKNHGIKYIPFSIVEEFLLSDAPSKYLMTKVLSELAIDWE